MVAYVAAIAGMVACVVVYGLLMVGAHENQTKEKKRLDMSCSSCSSKGTCSVGSR